MSASVGKWKWVGPPRRRDLLRSADLPAAWFSDLDLLRDFAQP